MTASEQPTNFKGEAISATALRLSWDKSDDSTILHYIIYYNISSHQNKWVSMSASYMRPIVKACVTKQHAPPPDQVKISANVHEYELEQLQPDTIYHLAISSKAAEESARTDIIQVKTFQYGFISAIICAPPPRIISLWCSTLVHVQFFLSLVYLP